MPLFAKHEVARELGVSTKEVVRLARELGVGEEVTVRTMLVFDERDIDLLRQGLEDRLED